MSVSGANLESSMLRSVDASVIESSIRKEALRSLSNKLYYNIKPSSSALIKSRKTVSFPASNLEYQPGGVINIKVSSNAYIDFSNSYIKWKMCTTRKNAQLAGRGQEMLINRLRIEAQSNVIEDIENYNLWCKQLVDHTVNPTYKNTVMQSSGWWSETNPYRPTRLEAKTNGPINNAVAGANISDNIDFKFDNVVFGDDTSTAYVDATGNGKYAQLFWPATVNAGTGATDDNSALNPQNTFTFPLYGSGFCSQQVYIPKQIGAIDFSITLENASIALLGATNDVPSYKIREVELVCDVVQLSDDISAMIDRLSSEGKLTLVFDTVVKSSATLTGTSANINITKYAANVKGVYSAIRPIANISGADLHQRDSFASVPASYITSYFFRIDDWYIPVKPVDSTNQAYIESALKGFNKFNNTLYPSASYQEFLDGGKCIIACDLERDPTSSFTGSNTRGGRNIVLTLGLNPASINNGNADAQIFTQFTRTLTIMSGNNYVIAE